MNIRHAAVSLSVQIKRVSCVRKISTTCAVTIFRLHWIHVAVRISGLEVILYHEILSDVSMPTYVCLAWQASGSHVRIITHGHLLVSYTGQPLLRIRGGPGCNVEKLGTRRKYLPSCYSYSLLLLFWLHVLDWIEQTLSDVPNLIHFYHAIWPHPQKDDCLQLQW